MKKTSAIIADSLIRNKRKVAEDVTIELPEIAVKTATLQAMGDFDMPITGLLEAMEATITKIGVDESNGELGKLENADYEARWVQDEIAPNGEVSKKGCKAFLKMIPKTIPGISLEIGSIPEGGFGYTVMRYQLFYDGKELLLVDRLTQDLRVGGVDYMKDIKRLL